MRMSEKTEKQFWRRVSDDSIVFCEVYGEPNMVGEYKSVEQHGKRLIQTAATIELNRMRGQIEALTQSSLM